jgi:hypothetical protein
MSGVGLGRIQAVVRRTYDWVLRRKCLPAYIEAQLDQRRQVTKHLRQTHAGQARDDSRFQLGSVSSRN